MIQPLLAKADLKSLAAKTVRAYLQNTLAKEDEVVLVQNHAYVDGSMDGRLSAVRSAFNVWRRGLGEDCYEYRWSCILGIFEGSILFFVDNYGDYNIGYYTVDYAFNDETATIDASTIKKVDVRLVMSALSVDADEEMEGEQAVKNSSATGKPMTQKMTENHEITDDAKAAKPVSTSAENEKVPTGMETDANSDGASIPDPLDAAKAKTGVEHSGEEGVGEGDMNEGEKPSAGPDEAGTKQSTVEVFTKDHLLQSAHIDSARQSLSYIQLQSVSTDEATGKKTMKVQGIATRADIVNVDGVVYPLSVWQANLDRMNQEASAGKFLGKLEHPTEEQGLVDTALKFDKFWLQGSDLWFDATVVPTEPYGKNLQTLIESGVTVDLSSRGYGTVKQGTWHGQKRKIIQDDFVCLAFDAVWHGASTGSSVKTVEYQAATEHKPKNDSKENDNPNMETQSTTATAVSPAQAEANALAQKRELNNYKTDVIANSGLSEMGRKALQAALDQCDTLDAVHQTKTALLPVLTSTFAQSTDAEAGDLKQSVTHAPTFYVKQSAEEMAPKNVGELFDRMVADLPDTLPGTPSRDATGGQSHFVSMRQACKSLLINTANEARGSFNGRSAALGLLALEQGKIERAGDILTQSLAPGSTVANGNAANDGAPLSAPLIFPLIRRVFPRYIMNEIASIQVMDRPQGKIFYEDHYRTNSDDSVENRIDLNTSSNPFNSSYAQRTAEGSSAPLIRLRLSNITVEATTKALGAQWSIEEMQDLRAYHGLDAAQELMSGVAREMALEYNMEVLNDMLAQATAGALTYGTTAPASGYPNQKDWDEYIWAYIQKLDNLVFSKRNGPITHLVCGVDAALALAKGMRYTTTIGGENGGDMELYPGTSFFGTVTTPTGSRYKIMKTNFWGAGTTNGSKILGLRKGDTWSDTAYVWAPYTDYITPQFTNPSDFSQMQGVMSRAAKQVVVSDAMGYITVSNTQGVTV